MSKFRAVLIGNGHFDNSTEREERLDEIGSPTNDVIGLGDLLASRKHGKFEITRVIDQHHWQISAAVNDVLNMAEEDDTVLVYFSGHAIMSEGYLYLAAYGTELQSTEAASLPFVALQGMIATKSVRGNFNVIVVLDCCFSGMASDSLPETIVTRGGFSYILTASIHERSAFGKADGYSLLTKHIIEGIETGAADFDCDGWVTMDELERYVVTELSKTERQIPHGRCLTHNWQDLRLATTSSDARSKKLRAVFDKVNELKWNGLISDDMFEKSHRLIKPAFRITTDLEKRKLVFLYDLLARRNEEMDDVRAQWQQLEEEEADYACTDPVFDVPTAHAQRITRNHATLDPAFEEKGAPKSPEPRV